MQFSVPQFTEVEDKIIGPFTLKQFLIMLAGSAVVFLLFRLIPNLLIFIVFSLPIAGITLFAAFGSYNGKSMGELILASLNYYTEPTSYIFHKISVQPKNKAETSKNKKTILAPAEQTLKTDELSRLHKLSYILDQDIKAEESLLKDKYVHLK